MATIEGNELVLLVTTPDGIFVRAGDPKLMDKKTLAKDLQAGYQFNTITITEYRERVKTAKWIFETT